MLILGVFALCTHLLAQNRTVSGRVTDDKGNGLSDVFIQVKGTPLGTVSTSNGSYSISVPPNARVLVFSSVDMGTQEVTIGGQTTINVSLIVSTKNLEEVVIVGYGTQKRADVTGSVATVKSQDIENKPFTSIDKALQGQVAGLQSVTSSGAPGANQCLLLKVLW